MCGIMTVNELGGLVIDGELVKYAGAVNDSQCEGGVALGVATDGGYYRYEMDPVYWQIEAASGADAIDAERYWLRLLGYIPYYN